MEDKQPDLLLIKPGSQDELYGKLSSDSLTGIEPPLWAGLIATFVRDRGYKVRVLDAEAEGLSPREVCRKIERSSPRLAAIIVSGTNPSASTMNMTGARAILEEISKKNLPPKTLLAGLHPSALPRRTMEEEKTEYVCEGEGFYTITELLAALEANPANPDTGYIKGLWHRKEGQIIGNGRAPLVQDLDKDLHRVAWELLPMDKYRAHNWHCFQEPGQKRRPYGVIYTSLGCPFNCKFCCINAIFGGPGIRYRSPRKVIEELDLLVNTYGVKNIKIIDEMFVLNERHVLAICNMIIERGYRLNIWAYARINTVNERMLQRLKEAGVNWLAYGIESGNDRVLNSITKGITVEKTREAIKMTRQAGINVIGNYILGLPEDDLDSMQDTMDLAAELNCEFINIYCATAYPGSKLFEQAQEEGWELPHNWAAYSPYAYEHRALPTNYLSGTQVLRFRDEAYVTYIKSERYQQKVKEKFGEAVLEEINNKLTGRLRRKYLEDVYW